MANWGLISTNTWLLCTDLTYPKSPNTSGVPLHTSETEEVSNLCYNHDIPGPRNVRCLRTSAVLFCWMTVYLDCHDSRGSGGLNGGKVAGMRQNRL
jgi:hypothetical protein